MIESVERSPHNVMAVVWQLDKCHENAGFVTHMS